MGHYFNLRHIWGDTEDCSGTDFVADTPNAAGPNYGTPTFPSVSCSNGPNGDMFMNYMDYVDDVAMFLFTSQQVVRMRAAPASGSRSAATARPGSSSRVRTTASARSRHAGARKAARSR